jgi:chromosome segregation protein
VSAPSDGPARNTRAGFRFTRCHLAGFGLYDSAAGFVFPAGPGVLLGPNESGKSTLLHGLTAVLFGLPSDIRAGNFGSARFRSFSHPKEFWGEVEWERLGRVYRLRRVFETHHVRLTEKSEKGATVLFTGEHNPQATSPAGSAFPRLLREHIGLGSRQLFEETFCITQPLVQEGSLSTNLQQLLSGSRSGRVDQVLSSLFDQVTDLTKHTKDLGLSRTRTIRPTTQRNPGRSEILGEELEKATRQLRSGREQLERWNAHTDELDAVLRERQSLRESIEGKEARLKLLRRWLDLDEERRRLVGAVELTQRALSGIAEVTRQQAELEIELRERYAAYRDAPPWLLALLDDLERTDREEREARTAEASGGALLADLSREARILQSALADEDGQGPEPNPEMLRAEAGALLGDLQRCAVIEARLAEIDGVLQARAFLSGTRLNALKEKIAAERRLKDLSLQLRELEAREAVQARKAAEDRAAAAERARTIGRPSPISLWIALGAGAAVTAAASLGLDLDLPVALVIGLSLCVALLILGWVLRGRRSGTTDIRANAASDPATPAVELPALTREAEELNRRIAAISPDLGPFVNFTEPELARMEEQWSLLSAEKRGLDTERDALLLRHFGVEPSHEWRASPLDSLPDATARLRRIPHAPATGTASDLVAWLRDLPERSWQDLTVRAAERAETERKLHAVTDRMNALPQADTLRAAAEEAADRTRQAWRKLTEAWPAGHDGPTLPQPIGPWILRVKEEFGPAASAWQTYDELLRRRDDLLKTPQVKSVEELQSRYTEENAALGDALRRLKEMEAAETFLAATRAERDPLRRAQLLEETEKSEQVRLQQEKDAVDSGNQRELEIRGDMAVLKGSQPFNLAHLEIRIRQMEEEQREIARRRDALVQAWRWVREAADAFQSTYRADLEGRITDRFNTLTGVPGRRVSLDETFALAVYTAAGEPLAPEQLSQGARDQLLLSIRLAVADLLAGDVPLPLFFDDPFVHFDVERMGRLRVSLQIIARERQWILLTHREDLAGWGEPVVREEVPA